MTSPMALMTSLNRAALSCPINARRDVDLSLLQGIDRLTLCHTIARHAELTHLERHTIRQLGTDGETPRRTKDHHNIVSLVQAFPRDNDTGTTSGCQVDAIDLARFHQQGFSFIQETAARRPSSDKAACSRISSSVSWRTDSVLSR